MPGPTFGGHLIGMKNSHNDWLSFSVQVSVTSRKTFLQWNEIFAEVTIASAILDRVLHHFTVISRETAKGLSETKTACHQHAVRANTTTTHSFHAKSNRH